MVKHVMYSIYSVIIFKSTLFDFTTAINYLRSLNLRTPTETLVSSAPFVLNFSTKLTHYDFFVERVPRRTVNWDNVS